MQAQYWHSGVAKENEIWGAPIRCIGEDAKCDILQTHEKQSNARYPFLQVVYMSLNVESYLGTAYSATFIHLVIITSSSSEAAKLIS